MARPTTDERHHRFQGKWLSNARLWSASTRLLAASWDTGQIHLTGVAVFLAVHHAWLLISDSYGIPADQVAREDCPIDPEAFARLDERFEGLRNEVAHLAEFTESGRNVGVLHTADVQHEGGPANWTITWTAPVSINGKKRYVEDSCTRDDILAVLDQLDPWLDRQYLRWIGERRETMAHAEAGDAAPPEVPIATGNTDPS